MNLRVSVIILFINQYVFGKIEFPFPNDMITTCYLDDTMI